MPEEDELRQKKAQPLSGVASSSSSSSSSASSSSSPADKADITDRNADQVNALLGPAPEGGGEEENWWDAPAPRVGPQALPTPTPPTPIVGPTRHRRGAPLLGLDKPLGHHRRGQAPILEAQGVIPGHRRGAAPLIGGGPSALAKTTGVDDEIAQKELQRRKQQQAMRIGPSTPAIGFGGHHGGERIKPTVAPTLAGDDKDNDAMRRVALQQRQGVGADLAELGTGRAPLYRGRDEATGDARAIVEDPRFAQNYALDRDTDRGGAVGRKVGEKKAELAEWWGASDRGAQLGKGVGRGLVRKVPFLGSGLALGGAYKEHNRAGVDEEVAEDESQDPLTRATAQGLAGSHEKARNKEVVSGTVGLVKDVVDVSTGGLSAMIPGIPGAGDAAAHVGGSMVDRMLDKGQKKLAKTLAPEALAAKAAWTAGKKGGIGVNKGVDWLNEARSPHQLRPGAVAPSGGGRRDLLEAGTDQANEGLMTLAASDGKFGAKMLDHLNADLPSLEETGTPDQEMRHRVQRPGGASPAPQPLLDAARAADPRSTEKGEHNLKPSQVARLVAGEAARGRQKERMGDTLGTLTDNENSRSWWEKGAGTDLKAKPKAEGEAEDESEEA